MSTLKETRSEAVVRMVKIAVALAGDMGLSRKEWADHFFVSERTIQRDIACLKNQVGLDIEYCRKQQAYVLKK